MNFPKPTFSAPAPYTDEIAAQPVDIAANGNRSALHRNSGPQDVSRASAGWELQTGSPKAQACPPPAAGNIDLKWTGRHRKIYECVK
jgi:hypothetical protein